jgi:hypothetical protein
MAKPKRNGWTRPPSRDEIDEILRGNDALLAPAQHRPESKPAVPVRLHSNYYWSPSSLLFGLFSEALPLLSAPSWKVCCAVAVRQLEAATMPPDAPYRPSPIALSLAELSQATGLSRVTVILAIRAAAASGWLTQTKRRTPHGGNAVALYSLDWSGAVLAEKRRRAKSPRN